MHAFWSNFSHALDATLCTPSEVTSYTSNTLLMLSAMVQRCIFLSWNHICFALEFFPIQPPLAKIVSFLSTDGWVGAGIGGDAGSVHFLAIAPAQFSSRCIRHLVENTSSRDLNQKIRDYIYSFVWRNNVAKDARLQELGKLAKTCKWKNKPFGFLKQWRPKINCFDHCKFMKTTSKSCKY